MKKILVPVDLSGNAESAVLYSADLAKTMPAKVYLFHSIILPEFYVTELNDYALYQKELNSKVDKIYDQSISLLHGMRKEYFADTLRVNCKVLPAKNIYNGILDYADELNPDLILLGEGEKLDKIRIGANAERVLRLTDLPVLVVKRNSKISKRKKVIFASDFLDDSVKVFSQVNEFLKDSNSSIRLLYINTKSKFEEYEVIKSRIEKFKKNFSADFSVVIRAGKSIEESIVRYANSIDADLISIGIKRKKKLSLYFTDRVTESVISLSDIPVLAVNNPG
ncbi:MAG: universal stress protein [Ignavibacteria bacterium]|jgi:nucleotide-binding universal stress UspA family protein